MIYVSKSQLHQVEYLIHQSIQGNHVLFDLETVRKIFWRENVMGYDEFSESDAYAVEHHIEKLILLPSLDEKKGYLENLDPETFERVVKTYFNIVENNLYENLGVKH